MIKVNTLFYPIFMAAAFCSCSSSASSENEAAKTATEEAVNDSIYLNYTFTEPISEFNNFEQALCNQNYRIDFTIIYPTADNATSQAIRRWIISNINKFADEDILKIKESDYNDLSKLADKIERSFVKKDIIENMQEAETWIPENDFSSKIDTLATTNYFITMLASNYNYTGGAHGITNYSQATFLAPDGKLMDNKSTFFNPNEPGLLGLVKEYLWEQYFNNIDDDNKIYSSLDDYLIIKSEDFQLPSTNPAFTIDGIRFQYQPYELVAYAYGAPYCIIPYDVIYNYLTRQARKLIPDKDEILSSFSGIPL